MSRTTLHWIKTADRRPTHEGAVEYPNAWLAHVMVWSHIGERYGVPFSLLKPEPVWALHARADLPLCDRVVMALTFDRAWVRRENFGRLAEAVAAARLLAGCHFHQAARDLLARAFCHEIDHLDQRLFVDRLSSLQTANPARLRIVAKLAGGGAVERAMHVLFAADRIRPDGEWFRPSQALAAFMREIGGAK